MQSPFTITLFSHLLDYSTLMPLWADKKDGRFIGHTRGEPCLTVSHNGCWNSIAAQAGMERPSSWPKFFYKDNWRHLKLAGLWNIWLPLPSNRPCWSPSIMSQHNQEPRQLCRFEILSLKILNQVFNHIVVHQLCQHTAAINANLDCSKTSSFIWKHIHVYTVLALPSHRTSEERFQDLNCAPDKSCGLVLNAARLSQNSDRSGTYSPITQLSSAIPSFLIIYNGINPCKSSNTSKRLRDLHSLLPLLRF